MLRKPPQQYPIQNDPSLNDYKILTTYLKYTLALKCTFKNMVDVFVTHDMQLPIFAISHSNIQKENMFPQIDKKTTSKQYMHEEQREPLLNSAGVQSQSVKLLMLSYVLFYYTLPKNS